MSDFPIEGEELPLKDDGTPYNGFLLFLDELNSADKYTMGAAYKLILDREVGKYRLHPKCKVIGAGNRAQDKALTNKLISPMKSRLTHIEMKLDLSEFKEFVAGQVEKGNWHPTILGFINFKPEHINNFNPDKDTTTYACPRTYEMLSKQLSAGLIDLGAEIYHTVITGIIGEQAGVDFNSFLDIMGTLPSIEKIISDPLGASLPKEAGTKWALGSYLYDKINPNNVDPIVDYIERIPEGDIKVIIYRMMIGKYPMIIQNNKVVSSMGNIKKKLATI